MYSGEQVRIMEQVCFLYIKGDVASKVMCILCTDPKLPKPVYYERPLDKLFFLTNKKAYIQFWQLESVHEIYKFTTGHFSLMQAHENVNCRCSLDATRLLVSSYLHSSVYTKFSLLGLFKDYPTLKILYTAMSELRFL